MRSIHLAAPSLPSHRPPKVRNYNRNRKLVQEMLQEYFADLACTNGEAGGTHPDAYDEFDEIVELLLEHRAGPGEHERWLAYAIATAAMGENHLWQDMGLPSRKVLSALMTTYFPTLAAKNRGDMKWKKFFYRQLCERAGVPICKSPHCADCCDFRVCFGPEDS